MSWIGGWLGLSAIVEVVEEASGPAAIPAAVPATSAEYVDVVARALDRIPLQFRGTGEE
jgi:hypothetical protein